MVRVYPYSVCDMMVISFKCIGTLLEVNLS